MPKDLLGKWCTVKGSNSLADHILVARRKEEIHKKRKPKYGGRMPLAVDIVVIDITKTNMIDNK